jgi:hypothetical protein
MVLLRASSEGSRSRAFLEWLLKKQSSAVWRKKTSPHPLMLQRDPHSNSDMAGEIAMIHKLLRRAAEEVQANPAREPISDVVAGQHDKALAKLRELLTRRGMRSQVVEWLKLTLRSSTFPRQPTSSLVRYPPELLVFSPQGWRVATVRIAPRSSAYLVEVAQVGTDNAVLPDRVTVIPADSPDKAAALIPGYQPDMP